VLEDYEALECLEFFYLLLLVEVLLLLKAGLLQLLMDHYLINSTHLIVPLVHNGLPSVFLVQLAQCFNREQFLVDIFINGADLDCYGLDLSEVPREILQVPGVPLYFLHCDPLHRVSLQHSIDEIFSLARHEIGNVKLPLLDLHKEVGDRLIVEGQRSADHGIENDPDRPDVHLHSAVRLPTQHLRSCIVWRSAGSLQRLLVFHRVSKSKVD